jgi:N-acetylmuramoyl-L-alanine amidase
VAKPRIITARSIGLTFRSNRSPMGPEKSVVGHYSATPRARNWRAGVASAKSFHREHLGRGWAGIGYHYLISDDGAIICCRPVLWNGAHVLNTNANRVGVNMPGTTGDRPTRRQARAFNWLLHHAHTNAMAPAHRTDNDLSKLPIFGHRELPGQSTACPGLFLGMYKRGGDPWREEDRGFAPDEFVALGPEDQGFEEPPPEAAAQEDERTTGPDDVEAEAEVDPTDEGELPDADDEHDEDLSEVLGEIEQTQPR